MSCFIIVSLAYYRVLFYISLYFYTVGDNINRCVLVPLLEKKYFILIIFALLLLTKLMFDKRNVKCVEV